MDLGIATDAWFPQVNGVVTTLSYIEGHLIHMGVSSKFYTPTNATYKLKFPFYKHVKFGFLNRFQKHDIYYVATPEGPIGIAATLFCKRNGIPYVTGFHTDWMEFFKSYAGVPNWIVDNYMKWAHKGSSHIVVPSLFTKTALQTLGFTQPITILKRGVNRSIFNRGISQPKHQAIYVGRVSKEKGVEDFLRLKHIPLVCVGDGPMLATYKEKYPHVKFLGELTHTKIADNLRESSLFVFPSKSDTFGLVMLEALACGVPVVGYPCRANLELIKTGENGVLCENLQDGILPALQLDRETVAKSVESYSWRSVTEDFLAVLEGAL